MDNVKTAAITMGLLVFYGFICVVAIPVFVVGIFEMSNSTDALTSFIGNVLWLGINSICAAGLFWLSGIMDDVRDMWRAVIEFVMEHQQDEEEDHQLEETKEEVLKEETEQEQVKGLADEPIVL